MEENTLSVTDKFKLPYTLLIDPKTQRAAAYTNTHKLITELASNALVAYALANTKQEAAFDRALHDPASDFRPLPAWATEDLLDGLKILWIKRPDGDAPASEWLAIPAR